jgi:hypothetical protein
VPLDVVEQALAAHGGLDLWESAGEVSVQLSAGGLAFASKLQGHAVRDVKAQIATSGQHVVFTPYPTLGHRGILLEDGTVRIETDAGELVQERANARDTLKAPRHRLWWDRLDMLYFGTFAIWTYMSAPFLFVRDGYTVRELDPWVEEGERWRRIAVTFPAHIHTHCREQVFHIDEAGLIRRHDYTAEPIGGWARAAHYCFDHEAFDGLVVPTRRRVYPRKANDERRAHPRLVWIDVPTASVVA